MNTQSQALIYLLLGKMSAWAEPMSTAGWEPYVPPPAEMFLQASGLRLAQALALFSKGLREELTAKELALASYKAALALDAHNVRLAARMANLMAGMGKFNDALALLEQAKADNLTQQEAWLELSRYCLRHHHGASEIKAKALQYAKQALEAFPDSAAVYVHLVHTYFDLSELSGGAPRAKAREVLARAEQSSSKSAAFWFDLVPSARQAYPLDDADTRSANLEVILGFVSKSEKFAGNDPRMAERLANFYQDYANRLKSILLGKRALPWFEQVTTQHPDNLGARRAYAALLRQLGDVERSTRMFQELVKINPQDLASHRALIKVAEDQQDAQGLITHRTEILRWEGGTPQEWLDLAQAMVKAQQFDQAVSLLKRARYAHPEEAALVAQLARVWQSQRKDFEGFDAFQTALNLATEFPEAKSHPRNAKLRLDSEFYFLGATLAARQPNQTDLATNWFRKALEVAKPETPDLTARCYHGLASLWLDRGEKIEEAGELLRTANALMPDHPAYLDGLGWYYFQHQDYATALTTLEKAEKLAKGTLPSVFSHLSECLLKLHRTPEALAFAEKAAMHPNASPAMKQRLKELHASGE
jgi:tetratricopeptide (TPR) repeat protein